MASSFFSSTPGIRQMVNQDIGPALSPNGQMACPFGHEPKKSGEGSGYKKFPLTVSETVNNRNHLSVNSGQVMQYFLPENLTSSKLSQRIMPAPSFYKSSASLVNWNNSLETR